MGTAIPMPDSDAQTTLSTARSAASQSLRGASSPTGTPPPPAATAHAAAAPARAPAAPPPDATAPPLAPPTDQEEAAQSQNAPAPPIDAAQQAPLSYPSAPPPDAVPPPTAMTGTGAELENALPQFAARAAKLVTMGVGGIAALSDATVNAATGWDQHAATDSVFNFKKNYIDPAIEHWTPDASKEGWGAQIVGAVAGMAPLAVMGPAGVALGVAEGGEEGAENEINQGHGLTSAAINGSVDAIGNYLLMRFTPSKLPLIKRVMANVSANDIFTVASNLVKQAVLQHTGNQQDAAKIHWYDGLGTNSAIAGLFGAIPHGGEKARAPDNTPEPEPNLIPGTAGNEPPPPGAKPVQGQTPAAEPVGASTAAAPPLAPPVAKTTPVVDTPTAEPPSDLKAQVADMKDPNTPRKYVYLSVDNVNQLGGPDGVRKLAAGAPVTANFDGKQGMLISRDQGARIKAGQLKKTQPDMQKVLGQLTGAGDGKSPDQTAVVQGQTPEGAVATESAVTPAEVPAAAQAVSEQGKTPVVTTPEAAIARRAEGVAAENAQTPPVEEGSTPPVEQSNATPQQPAKTSDLRTVRINGEDIPVRVTGEAVDGKVPVRMIDEDGRVSKDIRQVPEHMVSDGKEAASAETPATPTQEAVPDKAPELSSSEPAASEPVPVEKPAPAGEHGISSAEPVEETPQETPPVTQKPELQQALDSFKDQELPPAGRKRSGDISERASRVAELARQVKKAAAAEGVPEKIADDANETAKRAERLDKKSPEAMSKGQGISHVQLDAHAKELERVINNLLHPDKPVFRDDLNGQSPVKLAKVKAAIERNRAAAKKAPVAGRLKARIAKAEAQAEEVSPIQDVPDETKPRKLNGGDNHKIAVAGRRFLEAKDADAADARENIRRVLRDAYGPGGRDQADEMMRMLEEQRDEAKKDAGPRRPQKMSDTLEDDDLRQGHDDIDDESYDADRGSSPREGDWSHLQRLSGRMDRFWEQVKQARERGLAVNSHDILDHLINRSESGPLKDLLLHLRTYSANRKVTFHDGLTVDGEPATGAYHPDGRVQIDAGEGRPFVSTLKTMLHEFTHGAINDFIKNNPDHPLVKRLQALRQQALESVTEMHADMIAKGEIPDARPGKPGDLYGLKNERELGAEIISNPDFGAQLLRAGKYAERFGKLKDIFNRITHTMADMLGVKRGPERKLFSHIMDTTQKIMEAQHADTRAAAEGSGIDRDMDRPLEHEDEFRRVAGDHATKVARVFRNVMRSGTIEGVRRGTRAFTPYGGLVRAALRRGVFGRDESANPLRNYDELKQQRNAIINKQLHDADGITSRWSKLTRADNRKFGGFLRDSTLYGIDPRDIKQNGKPGGYTLDEAKAALPARVTSDPKFAAKWQEMSDRWNNLTPEQRGLYADVIDYNEKAMRANRKAAVDTALDSFSEKDIPAATRRLLYAVHDPSEFEALVGNGKTIDVGDRNDKLVETLKDLGSAHELEGPYAHLGRYGDHVVQVKPEGTKVFSSEQQARAYAEKIEDLGGKSKAKVAEIGGKWQVDYKADYVSMHETLPQADAEIARLRAAGYDVGSATKKLLSARTSDMTSGLQNLLGEVNRKLDRNGSDEASDELKAALRQSFVKILAAKSSYAGSKLARRGTGGVKPEEMVRSFANHAQSLAWNTSQLSTVFKMGDALAKLRDSVKDADQPQRMADQRGRVYDELTRRTQQENAQAGMHNPWNGRIAKAGFFNYLFSLSHSIIYLTQNFSTAIPTAGNRFGYGRAANSFGAAMRLISGPSFRESMRAMAFKQDADGILKAVVSTIAKDPRFGKWAQGENSPLQQLIDRGAVHTSFTNQLAEHAAGNNGGGWQRAIDWARIMPSFADMYNRVSTGLAALELHNGDVYKAGDFVRETHMDYSNDDRPRAFRAMSKIPGGNTVAMFRTYTTGMAHLLYSHVLDGITGEGAGRTQALKQVAGMMLGSAAFAGLQRSVGIEPIRLAMYAYNKLVGDNDKYHDFDNMSRQWIKDVVGTGKMADVLDRGLPTLLGMDMSSRLGLSDLFFHNLPDMTALDKSGWMKFGGSMLGPGYEEVVNTITGLTHAFQTGRVSDFVKAMPIKLLQNVNDALAAGTTGKINASGAQITQPSAYAAIIKAIGFKTNEEAKAGEKSETASDYRDFASNKQYQLVRDWAAAAPTDRQKIWQQIVRFNHDNPGHRITYSKLLQQRRGVARQGREAQGNSRDPALRQMLGY